MEQSVRDGAGTMLRPYASPTLVVHGTLVELTHGKGGGGKGGGATYGSGSGHNKFPPKS